MRKRKDLHQWWLERLQTLSIKDDTLAPQKLYENLPKHLQQNIQDREYWTIIKLAIHNYYLNLYLKIMRGEKQRALFRRIAYVDTFAGPGIIRVKHRYFFYGSPLLSILSPTEKFDAYIFIEKDPGCSKTLETVLRSLEKQGKLENVSYKVINQDMNDIDYPEILSGFDHSLVFVDPEGVEPNFSTIKNIASLKCDIVLNYMDSGIRRIYNRRETLDRFFCSNLTGSEKPEDLFNKYLECIKPLRQEVEYINVRGLGSFGYKIIFAVKRTKGGNPWFKAVNGLKKQVEKTQRETFETILQQFTGEQSIILDYEPNQ